MSGRIVVFVVEFVEGFINWRTNPKGPESIPLSGSHFEIANPALCLPFFYDSDLPHFSYREEEILIRLPGVQLLARIDPSREEKSQIEESRAWYRAEIEPMLQDQLRHLRIATKQFDLPRVPLLPPICTVIETLSVPEVVHVPTTYVVESDYAWDTALTIEMFADSWGTRSVISGPHEVLLDAYEAYYNNDPVLGHRY